MCHYKKEQKKQQKRTATKKTTRSKPLIAALDKVVKISCIVFESHQRGSSV